MNVLKCIIKKLPNKQSPGQTLPTSLRPPPSPSQLRAPLKPRESTSQTSGEPPSHRLPGLPTWLHTVQHGERALGGERRHVQVAHGGVLRGQRRQLVEVRGEQAEAADVGGHVLADGPRQAEAVVGGGAAAQLVDDDEGVLRGRPDGVREGGREGEREEGREGRDGTHGVTTRSPQLDLVWGILSH